MLIQTNLLAKIPHSSTVVCLITTHVRKDAEILKVHLSTGDANLNQPCEAMIDQVRAIDNRRLTERLGTLPDELAVQVKETIRIVLDLE